MVTDGRIVVKSSMVLWMAQGRVKVNRGRLSLGGRRSLAGGGRVERLYRQ